MSYDSTVTTVVNEMERSDDDIATSSEQWKNLNAINKQIE